jgi:hypothetical protein
VIALAGEIRAVRRPLWPLALVVLLAAAAVVLTATVLRGEDRSSSSSPTLSGPASAPFEVEYPSTWQAVGESQRLQLPGQPLAVLRRRDGAGTVVVTERPPVTTPLDELPRGLKARLSQRFPDFREVGAKVVSLGDTRALVYTFARTKTGTAQSLVVVPSGDRSFTLNAVVPPRSPEAAREVGAIIASFRPTGDS